MTAYGTGTYGAGTYGGLLASVGEFAGLLAHQELEPAFTIDGRYVLMSDWQAESEADHGDRVLTGRVAAEVTWAEQDAPVVAWLGDDPMWSGTLVADPRREGNTFAFRATGAAKQIEAATGPLLYRLDGAAEWVERESDPFDIGDNDKYDLLLKPALMRWRMGNGGSDSFSSGDAAGFLIWLEGSLITGYEFTSAPGAAYAAFDAVVRRFTGPDGARTIVNTHSLNIGSATVRSATISSPEDALMLTVDANASATSATRRNHIARDIKLYGLTNDDAFSASQVVASVGANAGLGTDEVQTNTLAVLPLYWTDEHTALLDYMAELTGWRWLVTHEGLSFGPWGTTWETATENGADAGLEPLPRYNRYVQPYRTISGAAREAIGEPTTDPFPGREVATPPAEELEDAQPNSALAEAVAAVGAEYHAAYRVQGPVELATVRYRGTARSPYEVMAGDQLLLTDLAPTIGAQRIQRVTKRPGGAVTVELGDTFNPVKAVADLQRDLPKRRRKKRRKR